MSTLLYNRLPSILSFVTKINNCFIWNIRLLYYGIGDIYIFLYVRHIYTLYKRWYYITHYRLRQDHFQFATFTFSLSPAYHSELHCASVDWNQIRGNFNYKETIAELLWSWNWHLPNLRCWVIAVNQHVSEMFISVRKKAHYWKDLSIINTTLRQWKELWLYIWIDLK